MANRSPACARAVSPDRPVAAGLGIHLWVTLGGAQLPHVIEHAGTAFFCSANIATAAHAPLTISDAATLSRFAPVEHKDAF